MVSLLKSFKLTIAFIVLAFANTVTYAVDYLSFSSPVIRVDASKVALGSLLKFDISDKKLEQAMSRHVLEVSEGKISADRIIEVLEEQQLIASKAEVHWRGSKTSQIVISNVKGNFIRAQHLATSLLKRHFEEQFDHVSIEAIPGRVSSIEVDFSSIQIKALDKLQPRKRLSVWAELIDDANQIVGEAPIWFSVKVKKKVFVAGSYLASKTSLDSSLIEMKLVDVTGKSAQVIADPIELEESWLIRAVKKGAPILKRDIEQEPLIKRHEKVSVRFSSNNISMITNGTALNSGYRGEHIKVQVDGAKKPVTVKIIKKKTVIVESINV